MYIIFLGERVSISAHVRASQRVRIRAWERAVITVLCTENNISTFRLEYQCGGLLSSPTNALRYPEFNANYKSNEYCVWLLQVPGYDKIYIKQMMFEMENSPSMYSC